MRDDSTVVPFADLGAADVGTAGGKGANLGELTRAGLPVPPGFVVTADAFLAAMDEGGVRTRIRSLFEDLHEPEMTLTLEEWHRNRDGATDPRAVVSHQPQLQAA